MENASAKLNLSFDNEENRILRAKMEDLAKKEGIPLQTEFLKTMCQYGDKFGLQIIPITACSSLSQLEEILKL